MPSMLSCPRQPLAVLAAVLVTSACGSSNTPTAPTPQSIAVTANVASLTSAGQTVEATASVRLPNGSAEDVTATCTGWQSDNTGVLTVSSTGLLTAHGNGSATITAMCQGATGRAVLTVALKPTASSTFTLSGTVTDNFSHGILPNILVQITSGPNAGAATKTDAAGQYVLTGISPATITVAFSAVSYNTTNETVSIAGDTQLPIVLSRNLLNPHDGSSNYSLTLQLVSATGCNHGQPVLFGGGTLPGSLVVTGEATQMQFGPVPASGFLGFQGVTFTLTRTANQLTGTLKGATAPSTFQDYFGLILVFDMTVTSGTVDNSTGQMSGIVTGYYDVDGQPPTTQSCTGGVMAFTLAPQP